MKRLKVQDLKVSDFMTPEVVTASPEDTVADVLGRMKKHEVHELPVLEGRRLLGVVTMRSLMQRKAVPPTTKVRSVMAPAPEIDAETPLAVAAEKMIESGFRAVPVVRKRQLAGILSRTDLVRALVDSQALAGLAVREYMTPNPQCVATDATVEHAVKMMQALGERSIPVVDRNRRLKGVVGMKDVVDLFARPKARIRAHEFVTDREKIALEVKGLMRYPPVTVGPEVDVHEAADLMLRHNISSVIVVQQEEPVGILTKADLMHVLAGLREREQLFVELSGLEDEPPSAYDEMYDLIQKEMTRIANLVTPKTLSIHVQKYKPEGDRWKWSLRARFATARRVYHMTDFDWDLQIALGHLLDGLYRRIVKEKERAITDRKRHHQVSPGPSTRPRRASSPRRPRRPSPPGRGGP